MGPKKCTKVYYFNGGGCSLCVALGGWYTSPPGRPHANCSCEIVVYDSEECKELPPDLFPPDLSDFDEFFRKEEEKAEKSEFQRLPEVSFDDLLKEESLPKDDLDRIFDYLKKEYGDKLELGGGTFSIRKEKFPSAGGEDKKKGGKRKYMLYWNKSHDILGG